MPTENENKRLYMIDERGNQKELGTITSLGINEMQEDELKATIETDVEITEKRDYSGEISFTIEKNEMKKLKKTLGIQTIKRKRFIKLLMGKGIQKRDAIKITEAVHKACKKYEYFMVDFVTKKIYAGGADYGNSK